MVTCPDCSAPIDLDIEELDEGDLLTCDECGAELKVLSLDPIELESAEDEDEDEEDLELDESEDEEHWH